MQIGTKLGLIFSLLGAGVGLYFGLSPVYQALQSGAMSGAEAGTVFAVAFSFVGAVLAAISVFTVRKSISRKEALIL